MAQGATVLFGTGAAAGLLVDSSFGVGVLSKGSARVPATAGKGIICGAFLADPFNSPPTSMANLTIVKKTNVPSEDSGSG